MYVLYRYLLTHLDQHETYLPIWIAPDVSQMCNDNNDKDNDDVEEVAACCSVGHQCILSMIDNDRYLSGHQSNAVPRVQNFPRSTHKKHRHNSNPFLSGSCGFVVCQINVNIVGSGAWR